MGITAPCDEDEFIAIFRSKEVESREVPTDLGIGGGSAIEFEYCLDCGRIQGDFPLDMTEVEDSVYDDEEEDEEDDEED